MLRSRPSSISSWPHTRTHQKRLAPSPRRTRFADEEYYSVNAFVFVNKAGHKQAVRYVAMPEKLVHLTPDEAGKKAPDFLVDELPTRIAQRPVVFHLKAQLAGPGDPTNDASRPWPETRKVVELGVLTLTKSVPDSRAAQKEFAIHAHESYGRHRAFR